MFSLANNNYEDDALLDKYEYDMEKLINDNYLIEKEQANQRLFQSFQTSACAVAQMFKDKTSTPSVNNANAQPQLTQWQSFQNSAGAITVLYKGKHLIYYLNILLLCKYNK
jgi:D-alanine-D-alanine ligase-like ATP-grasp enzyme